MIDLVREGEAESEILRTVDVIRDCQFPTETKPAFSRRRPLFDDEVREIRKRLSEGEGMMWIAEALSVPVATVRDLKNGRSYKKIK